MQPSTIKPILAEKQAELEKYLARDLKAQKDMRTEKHLAYAADILEGLSHQIGYMNGAIEANKQFLEMLEISDKEFWARRKEVDEHNSEVMEQLRKVVRRKPLRKATI